MERYRPWPDLRYYPEICMSALRITTRNVSGQSSEIRRWNLQNANQKRYYFLPIIPPLILNFTVFLVSFSLFIFFLLSFLNFFFFHFLHPVLFFFLSFSSSFFLISSRFFNLIHTFLSYLLSSFSHSLFNHFHFSFPLILICLSLFLFSCYTSSFISFFLDFTGFFYVSFCHFLHSTAVQQLI